LILISALVLVSAAAQAGQPRGLIVASNDERIESVQPDQPKADVKPEASQPATEAAKPEASKTATEAQKPVTEVSKPVRKAAKPASTVHAHDYASQEARARSIAARYGISW
jgi:cytoskeletal protein RodZ